MRDSNLRPSSADRGRQTADQLASAFGRASLYRDGHAIDCQRVVGSNDLVHAMGFSAWVGLWTIDFVTESGDCSSPNVVIGGAANHFAAMVVFVSDCNDFQRHLDFQ